MALVRYSPEYIADSFTLVDNMFINEYLPSAPDDAIRIYLYGLYLCNHSVSTDNNADAFIMALSISATDLEDGFKYWEERGLIEIISKRPLEIRYLPLKQSMKQPRKFNADKYSDFNRQLQDLFPAKMITPNEYSEYYYLIESAKLSPEAMLMIVKYCIDYKGENIRYPYILTVARNWADDGILSVEAVETRLRELEANSEEMLDLYHALGKKGSPSITDMQDYTKWTRSWGFSAESILFAAKTLKNKGSISKLDKLLDEYFRMDIFDLKDIEAYVKNRELMYTAAIAVNKSLGVYYESLDNVVETYISTWMSKGYDEATLILIADYCFKGSIRKLDGMNDIINKFYKLGLVSSDSINDYLANLLKNDNRIKAILDKAEINKYITSSDRNYYKTWSEDWQFSDELISYAAELSAGRARAFTYINKTLSNWKNDNISTLEMAMNHKPKDYSDTGAKQDFIQRTYTKDQLNSLFDDIDDLGVTRE